MLIPTSFQAFRHNDYSSYHQHPFSRPIRACLFYARKRVRPHPSRPTLTACSYSHFCPGDRILSTTLLRTRINLHLLSTALPGGLLSGLLIKGHAGDCPAVVSLQYLDSDKCHIPRKMEADVRSQATSMAEA